MVPGPGFLSALYEIINCLFQDSCMMLSHLAGLGTLRNVTLARGASLDAILLSTNVFTIFQFIRSFFKLFHGCEVFV